MGRHGVPDYPCADPNERDWDVYIARPDQDPKTTTVWPIRVRAASKREAFQIATDHYPERTLQIDAFVHKW